MCAILCLFFFRNVSYITGICNIKHNSIEQNCERHNKRNKHSLQREKEKETRDMENQRRKIN